MKIELNDNAAIAIIVIAICALFALMFLLDAGAL